MMYSRFDFIVIAAAVIASIIEASVGLSNRGQERTLDFILVLRVLRLVRLAGSIERLVNLFYIICLPLYIN